MGYKKRTPVRAMLVDFWMNNQRKPVGFQTIAEETGLNETQVRVGMSNILSDNILPGMRKVVAGRTWAYEPESVSERPEEKPRTQTPESTPRRRRDKLRTFEEVGETRDGALIIRDDRGTLYRAEEM